MLLSSDEEPPERVGEGPRWKHPGEGKYFLVYTELPRMLTGLPGIRFLLWALSHGFITGAMMTRLTKVLNLPESYRVGVRRSREDPEGSPLQWLIVQPSTLLRVYLHILK